MDAVSSTTSAQAASQTGALQFRLQQAQRNADRADQLAQALQSEAQAAQQAAAEAQGNAQTLAAQSSQAQASASQAEQGLQALRSANLMTAQLSNVASQVVAREQATQAPVSATPQTGAPAGPVVNTNGQVTGTLINVTA
jgi:uncharacterized protein (DUF3084 family)